MAVKTGGKATELFPRGRKKKVDDTDTLTQTQTQTQIKDNENGVKRQKLERPKDDDLFATANSGRNEEERKKKAKAKKRKDDKSGGKDDDGVFSGLKVVSADPLNYRQLSEGQTLLGSIFQIGDYDMKVSLPGRLVGTLPITAVSRPYTRALEAITKGEEEEAEAIGVRPLKSMFQIGQIIICSVTKVEQGSVEGFYKVSLSATPQSVQGAIPAAAIKRGFILQSAVASVEDHGYIMDVGVGGITAFLPKKKAAKYVDSVLDGEEPSVGQILPTLVTKGCEAGYKSINLTAEPIKLKKSMVDAQGLSLHVMIPGMSLKTRVEKVIRNGVMVSFGSLKGYVNRDHMKTDPDSLDEGSILTVRLLYVLPTVNTIYFSEKTHLAFGMKPENPFLTLTTGTAVRNAEVIRSDPQGIIVKLNDTETGFVSPRQVSETGENPKELNKKHPVGSTVSCRIIQFDFCEQMFVCSMQKSQLSQRVLQWDQLNLGEKVTCKVKKYVQTGAVVEVAKNMDGFIPMLHLSDVPLKNPEKKFPPDSKLHCRVLKMNSAKRQLHLTAKSILVKEDYPIVSTYDPANVGVVTEGTVITINSSGLILQLFGDAKGWVPKSKISTEPVEYPEKLFFLGQVLKCQVVHVEEEKSKMTLSLVIGGTHRPLGSKQRKKGDKIMLGSFYDCIVSEVKEDGLTVMIGDVKAFIPKNHLTDHTIMADQLLQSYQEGDAVSQALCFEQDVLPVLTFKPLILSAVRDETVPKVYDDLQEGVTVVGAVCFIKNYGVFLRLPTWKFRKSALIPLRYMADTFVEDSSEFVTMHQTLIGKVVERDDDEQKVTMSSKLKDMSLENTSMSVELTKSLFSDFCRLREKMKGALACFAPGMATTCTVTKVTTFGIFADVQGLNGIVTNTGLAGLASKPAKGDLISAVVLFVDADHECLELTAQPDIVKRVTLAGKKEPKEGTVVKAVAVLRKTEYYFASLCIKTPAAFAGKIVHVPTRHHINDHMGFGDLYAVGEIYNIVIKFAQDGSLIGVLEKHDRKTIKPGKRVRLDSESGSGARKRTESESSVGNEAKRVRSNSQSSDVVIEDIKEELSILNDPGWEDYNPWGTDTSIDSVKGTDDKDTAESGKKLKTHISKKEKKSLDRLEAEEIAKAEQRVLDGEEAEPETTDEFDRLVLSSPNSSLCWIKYIAFHLERKEFDVAREVVAKALEKINFREDDERLNVYMAWLNLENAFGEEEAIDDLLAKALKYNDQYKVYSQAAHIFNSSGKADRAEKLFKMLVRKFCKEPEVWTKLGQFYFSQGNLKEARFTLQRSLQNLEMKHHVDISCKFGQLEFKLGEIERAKEVFQKILDNYPRRIDIWLVYIDQLVKKGQLDNARNVFESTILLNLQPKKMKVFFKKYVEFETTHGDQQKVDRVRKRALEYVESKLGVSAEVVKD
jgi:rRNA biogenesis protein RRP5